MRTDVTPKEKAYELIESAEPFTYDNRLDYWMQQERTILMAKVIAIKIQKEYINRKDLSMYEYFNDVIVELDNIKNENN